MIKRDRDQKKTLKKHLLGIFFVWAVTLIPSIPIAQGAPYAAGHAAASDRKSATGPTVRSVPRYWDGYWEGYWDEECVDTWVPSITDRDFDLVVVCTYVWVEYWVDVWIPDPEDCPATAPSSSVTNLKSIVLAKVPTTSSMSNEVAAVAAMSRDATRSSPLAKKISVAPHRQVDYFSKADSYLATARTYRPQANAASALVRQNFGKGWFSKWDKTLSVLEDGAKVAISRGDGTTVVFTRQKDGAWANVRYPDDRLAQLSAISVNAIGWTLTRANSIETYDERGRLTNIGLKDGKLYSLQYTKDAAGYLKKVADSSGRELTFGYDELGRVSLMTDPSGGVVEYSYDNSDRLTRVGYSDGNERRFSYENSTNLLSDTSMIAGDRQSVVTFDYDPTGLAVSSTVVRDDLNVGSMPALSKAKGPMGERGIATATSCPIPPPQPQCTPAKIIERARCNTNADITYQNQVNACLAGPFVLGACLFLADIERFFAQLSCSSLYPECG